MSDSRLTGSRGRSRRWFAALRQKSDNSTALMNTLNDVERAVTEALSQEGKQPEGLVQDTQYLSALYKGYKHAYEALSQITTDAKVENAKLAAQVRDHVSTNTPLISENTTLHTSNAELQSLYEGYKGAYDILHEEVGFLRAYSAPYVRPDKDVIGLEDKPSIFIVTLPKSATVYIANSIALTLDYRLTNTLVTPMFPKNVVWATMAHDFQRGGMVSASHMQPDATNLAVIKQAGLRKIVLHIRDPRAALLSWVHFVFEHGDVYQYGNQRIDNPAGQALNELSFEERSDKCLETFFLPCIDWIATWIKETELDDRMKFLIVHHEELVADEEVYFAKIMSHYGIDARIDTVKKDETTHFRNGDNEEWRTAFTQDQIARMNETIPDWMWERFGWEK